MLSTGFPDDSHGKECLQCGRPKFDPWVRKILWRREWQPTPIFLPGEFCRQRSLVGSSPWGHKELDTTEWLIYTQVVSLSYIDLPCRTSHKSLIIALYRNGRGAAQGFAGGKGGQAGHHYGLPSGAKCSSPWLLLLCKHRGSTESFSSVQFWKFSNIQKIKKHTVQ